MSSSTFKIIPNKKYSICIFSQVGDVSGFFCLLKLFIDFSVFHIGFKKDRNKVKINNKNPCLFNFLLFSFRKYFIRFLLHENGY